LLAEVRAEISTITTRITDNKGKKEILFDVPSLQKNCPLLVSSWKETLRTRDAAISSRVVDEDTVLNDAYLLKKGSIIQIPSGEMNTSSSIWGPTADVFNARRFLKANNYLTNREQARLQKLGFNPFGGGSVLCPGRHFATTEILGVAATILMGYDLRMADGSGILRVPEAKKQLMSVVVLQPTDGLNVLINRRKEYEGVSWTYDVGGEISSEDLVF
jgi:cytochrome P450